MSSRPPHIGKHLTPGRAILLALAALLLAFLLASHLTGAHFAAEVEELKRRGEPVRVSELVPRVPPGQPNAADLYAKAFAVAPPSDDVHAALGSIEHWSPQELAAAAQLVAAHADYYRLLDEASRVQVCAFPVNWDSGFLMEQHDLGRLADAGRALAVKAQVQVSRGDLDGAAETCATQFRLADHARQDPTMTGFLVSTGQHSIADKELARVLARGDLSPAVCRTLYAQLAAPDWQAAFSRTLQAERAYGLAALAQVDRGLFSGALRGGDSHDWQMTAVTSVGRPWCNLDKADYLQMMARRIEASRQPWAEANRRLRAIDGEPRNVRTDTTPITWQVRQPVAHLHLRATRTAAQDGAARIALALTVYHHDHGAYPGSLAELARAGWKLPPDPFTQKPYHYRREGRGFAVWSIGPDLYDNHATAYDPHTFREDQPGYDFVFRCARWPKEPTPHSAAGWATSSCPAPRRSHPRLPGVQWVAKGAEPMDPSPQLPAESAGHTYALRWRPFAWWRTALAVAPICALIIVALPLFGRPQDELWGWAFLGWLYLAVPALFLALPSAFIASLAHRRRRGAVYAALVHDAVILAIALRAIGGTVRNEFGFDQATVTYDALPWIGVGAAFGAEAAYLLRVAFRWHFAWPVLAVLVAGATAVAVATPPVIAARRLAHVRPLLRYADAHWFAIPRDAKITVGRSHAGAGHVDTITIVSEHAFWTVRATHDRTGRWVRAGSDSDPAGSSESAGKEAHVEVRTRDDARRVLTVCGVPDHALRFQDLVLSPGSKDITAYQFWSPLARTRYEVYVQGDVRLVWEQPLDLEQPGRRK